MTARDGKRASYRQAPTLFRQDPFGAEISHVDRSYPLVDLAFT